MVDQIAEGILAAVFDSGFELIRSAVTLAFLVGVFLGGAAGLVQVGARDDFVIHAGDDFFDDLGIGAFGNLFRLFRGGRPSGGARSGFGWSLGWRFGGGLRLRRL